MMARRLFVLLVTAALSYAQSTLATFTLADKFGVAWGDQPIEFRYDGGLPNISTTRMMLNGTEVPYQWVSSCSDTLATLGCIAVRGSLPVNATQVWTLQSGAAPTVTATHPVVLATVANNYELTNGLTGVRIVTAAGNHSPWNLAPIQGVKLTSGTWTGAGGSANLLYIEPCCGFDGDVGQPKQTPAYTATGYTVTVVDSGPLKTVLRADYTFNRPQYHYGSGPGSTTGWMPPGPGHYTATFTLYANSKSVLIDEDSDMMFTYYVPIYAQITPDKMRIKDHYSSDPMCGYDPPGAVSNATNATPIVVTAPSGLNLNGHFQQKVLIEGVGGNTAANGTYWAKTAGYSPGQFALYADANFTTPIAGNGTYTSSTGTVKPTYVGQFLTVATDGFVDISYSQDRKAFYQCAADSYKKLVNGYPAGEGTDNPWYLEFYNSTAGSSGPVVGMYSGRTSQQIGGVGPSTPGPYTSPSHWITSAQDAGFQVEFQLQGADGRRANHVHRNWGIWVSTQADILSPELHQPIADDSNFLTGINLSRMYTYELVFADPSGGWKWLFQDAATMNTLVGLVRDGTSKCGTTDCYWTLLRGSDTYATALLDMWHTNTTAGVQTALDAAATFISGQVIPALSTGDNRWDGKTGYYGIGLDGVPQAITLNAILLDANSTTAQKTTAKASLSLIASLLWDNDWFPIDNDSGESLGNSNQIQQYLQYRATFFGAMENATPFMASKATQAVTCAATDFYTYFSPTGAASGSSHYQGAFFGPLIRSYTNFSQVGLLNMNDPIWEKYAKWELSIMTPPDPRFGDGSMRKLDVNGDSPTEGNFRAGMLATALKTAAPAIAANLQWAWESSNNATTLTEENNTSSSMDPNLTAVTPGLGSINIPGYYTSERHAFGTAHETALWFMNGDFFQTGGHRHSDSGRVSIYAHNAPLALDWSANMYYPETPGRFYHTSIVLDSEIGHAWDADNPDPHDAQSLLPSLNTEFVSLPESSHSTATFTWPDGTVWTRSVRTMAPNTEYPIIYVADSFSGPSAASAKTMTWQVMATGAVTTPAGSITPTSRFSTGCQSIPGQYPSSGTATTLSNGLQAFHFTGQTWAQHATGGIDWDLYQIPTSGSAHFLLGNWGNGCQNTRENGEYITANGGSYNESQHILRLHDTGSFNTVILPYRKTEAPTRTITSQTCGTQIVQGSETTCFDRSHYTYTDGTKKIVASFDASTHAAFGYTVFGGTQQISDDGNGGLVWTVSGAISGTRTLTLPTGRNVNYSYTGGLQADPVTVPITDAGEIVAPIAAPISGKVSLSGTAGTGK